MISYKMDFLKLGRASPICERLCKKIVGYLKNNDPQHQIAKALLISSSTVHNIIKRFRDTGEISVRKGQGRRPLLDPCGLQALRRHCIIHQHDSVIYITKWAQEYFQKPHAGHTIHQMPTKAQSHLKWTVSKWRSDQWSDESKFDILVGNHGRRVLRAKEEGDLPACSVQLRPVP